MYKLEAVEEDDETTQRFIRKLFKAGGIIKELSKKTKAELDNIKTQN